MNEKVKKDRSPQFPFIPLGKAVDRAREFESQYGKHDARPALAVKHWGYAEKSSGGIQTVAALLAFGLMEGAGSSQDRRIKMSELGMCVLKETRGDKQAEALKKAALRPKVMHELFEIWGPKRPPDPECISTLHLDKAFTEEAARRFLHVFDATISYAGLQVPDKILNDAVDEEAETARQEEPERGNSPARTTKVHLMDGERVVFAHELKPQQGFRVLVNGAVDSAMLEALEAFAKFQKALLKNPVRNVYEDPKAD
jgi:hypothetical protein